MRTLTEARDLALSIVETVAETVAEPLLVLDTKMKIKAANQAFYRVFRISPHETEGQLLYSISNSRWDIADLRDLLDGILRYDNTFRDLEIEQDFPAIGCRVLLIHGRRLDALPLILLSIDDVTDRRDRDVRLAAIVESSDDAIFSKTLDGTIVSWNSGAERIYGYAAHEIIGLTIATLAPPGKEEETSEIMERIRRGEKLDHFETKRRRKDGEIIDVSVTISPIEGRNGVITGASAVARDITRLKRSQQQAFTKHKLESLGRLADGIAHNFNNLLSGILASTELALAEKDASSSVTEELQKVSTATIRGAEIIRELMVYSGKQTLALEPVDISAVIEEMLPLLQISISKHATLKVDLGKGLPPVHAAPPQIREVILNLVTNASEAIGERDGLIRVTAARAQVGPNTDVIVADNLTAGTYVRLEVSDTGSGMAPDAQAKVFDPFFTTKDAGRGLGLAIVQGIIRAHGGAIGLRSALGRGTTFQILLPCSAEAAKIESAPAIAQPSESRQATILVVEDEDLLRSAVSKTLRKKGFSVLEASDGSAASELIHANKENIDLVLLDFTLPGITSRDVFEEARCIRPDLPVVLTSAYGKETVDALFTGLPVEHFIRKPFQLDELVALLEEEIMKASRPQGSIPNESK